jgi:predicted permease
MQEEGTMGPFLNDLRYAVRQLANSREFTVAALSTLALGIGANTAVFSVIYGVLVKSLPFTDADRIMAVSEVHPLAPGSTQVTYPDFLDWRAQQTSFEQIAAYSDLNPATVALYRGGHSEQVHRVLASGNFFPLLGVSPLIGRTLMPNDETQGHDHLAVLSETAWQRYFGRDTSVVGSIVELDNSPFTVVGVIPGNSSFPADGEVWLPLSLLDPQTRTSRIWHSVEVLGKVKVGVTQAAAAADMRTIAARLANSYPDTNRRIGIQLAPLRERLVGSFRLAMLCIMGSVLLVLSIACANVANLLLVRASAGQHTVAIRRALGATSIQLLSHHLSLALVICFIGGAIGTLMGWGLLPLLRFALSRVYGLDVSLVRTMQLSWPVLLFTLVVCLFTASLFAMLPALDQTQDISRALRFAGRATTRTLGWSRDILLSSEIAFAVSVLFLGLLLARSFEKLTAVQPGYRTHHLLSFEITLPGPKFQAGSPATDQFYEQLLDKLGHSPGVISVGSSNEIPLNPSHSMTRFLIKGAPPREPGVFPIAQIRTVNPGFFGAMGLGLEEGRIFTQAELSARSNLFVVNRAFAEQYLPGRDPVGTRVLVGVLSGNPVEVPIIGVVSNARDVGVASDPPPEIFAAGFGLHEVLLMRVAPDPESVIPVIQDSVHSIIPEQPVYNIQTIDDVLSASMAGERMTAVLIGIFAFVALVLAGIGIYGVVAFATAQRTQEIGIRLAVGAQRKDILRLVFKQAAGFTIIGLSVGLGLAFLCSRLVRSLLFNTSPVDSLSMVGTFLVILIMIGAGVSVPAFRAALTNPVNALRME